MRTSMILTVHGKDRPGLVEGLAEALAAHGGNWEESRLSRLAGHFAGVVRVTVDPKNADALAAAAREVDGLHVELTTTHDPSTDGQLYELELVGADHEGIVSRVSQALAASDVSIEELWTGREEAPHAGGMVFRARATLRAPGGDVMDRVKQRLEQLANEVMVEIWVE